MQHSNCHSNANVKNIDHVITKYGDYLMVKLENGQYFMSCFFFSMKFCLLVTLPIASTLKSTYYVVH